jgi:hypothetical protein
MALSCVKSAASIADPSGLLIGSDWSCDEVPGRSHVTRQSCVVRLRVSVPFMSWLLSYYLAKSADERYSTCHDHEHADANKN